MAIPLLPIEIEGKGISEDQQRQHQSDGDLRLDDQGYERHGQGNRNRPAQPALGEPNQDANDGEKQYLFHAWQCSQRQIRRQATL